MRPATEVSATVTRLGTPVVHYLLIFTLQDNPYVLYAACKCTLSHLNFIVSVHIRDEVGIEAGSYRDGSVVVYYNTFTIG